MVGAPGAEGDVLIGDELEFGGGVGDGHLEGIAEAAGEAADHDVGEFEDRGLLGSAEGFGVDFFAKHEGGDAACAVAAEDEQCAAFEALLEFLDDLDGGVGVEFGDGGGGVEVRELDGGDGDADVAANELGHGCSGAADADVGEFEEGVADVGVEFDGGVHAGMGMVGWEGAGYFCSLARRTASIAAEVFSLEKGFSR